MSPDEEARRARPPGAELRFQLYKAAYEAAAAEGAAETPSRIESRIAASTRERDGGKSPPKATR
ncbi:hypothetical protein [Paludisphaera soli]|uniref:hypothetical protein n=1 Tax=Paludisphaera soli TaxID=2712865 RepID=UPI0013EB8C8F|nr:hypothetical protein [Paludisphaera soli]